MHSPRLQGCFATAIAVAASTTGALAQTGDRPEFVQDGVYLTLQGSNAVGPLSGGAEWPAGDQMTYIAVDPGGELVIAASSAENMVYAYNAPDGELLAKIPVGETPKGVKFDREGRYAFSANEGSGTISVIDPKSLEVVKTIDVGPTPHSAVASPDNSRLYVAIQGGSVVAVIDLATLEKVGDTVGRRRAAQHGRLTRRYAALRRERPQPGPCRDRH